MHPRSTLILTATLVTVLFAGPEARTLATAPR
jgi:hypothetical protein